MQQEENQFDVIIVGAGPAGSAAAIALSKSDLKIALVDKYNFPRDKTCGDAIPGKTFKALNYIDSDLSAFIKSFSKGYRIRKTALFGSNGQKVVTTWKLFAYNASRLDFDNQLLECALDSKSVDFFQNEKVVDIVANDTSVKCFLKSKRTISAPIILGCDGAQSIVKKKLTAKEGSTTYDGVRQYFEGLNHLTESCNEVYHIKKYPKGYFWIFPLTNGICNVGFGLAPQKKSKVNVKHAFEDILKNDTRIAPLFKNATPIDKIVGAKLPIGGDNKPIAGNRFLLCGDAAALIDPLSGAGIDTAVWSGIFAAEQVIECFKRGDFSKATTESYQLKIQEKYAHQFKMNRLKMHFFTNYTTLFNLLLTLVSTLKKLK